MDSLEPTEKEIFSVMQNNSISRESAIELMTSVKGPCDCIKIIEENLKKRLVERPENPEDYTIIESNWEYKSWFPKERLYINYIAKHTFKKKDGSTSKPKNEHVSVFFTFCPFCGQKYSE